MFPKHFFFGGGGHFDAHAYVEYHQPHCEIPQPTSQTCNTNIGDEIKSSKDNPINYYCAGASECPNNQDSWNQMTLVPGAVLIPLRIATKQSMTKSGRILEN